MSVCQPRLGGNVIFSASIEISLHFFVQIPLINEHLFCKYFVRLSFVNGTKGFATYGCFHPCLYISITFWKCIALVEVLLNFFANYRSHDKIEIFYFLSCYLLQKWPVQNSVVHLYYAQLKRLDKVRVTKGLVVCYLI